MLALLEPEPRAPGLERVPPVPIRLVRETVADEPREDERVDHRTGVAELEHPLEDREIERGDIVTDEPIGGGEELECLVDPGRTEPQPLAARRDATDAPNRPDRVELQSVALDIEDHRVTSN